MPTPADHRFLEGSFAPVQEEITAFDLPVTGQVPAGLNGRYLRNGPNPLGLDFTAEPVARIHLPARIPLGFHGNWIPDH